MTDNAVRHEGTDFQERHTGYVCDGCALTFPETDMQWRGGTCLCPRCAEKAGWHKPMPDDGC